MHCQLTGQYSIYALARTSLRLKHVALWIRELSPDIFTDLYYCACARNGNRRPTFFCQHEIAVLAGLTPGLHGSSLHIAVRRIG